MDWKTAKAGQLQALVRRLVPGKGSRTARVIDRCGNARGWCGPRPQKAGVSGVPLTRADGALVVRLQRMVRR